MVARPTRFVAVGGSGVGVRFAIARPAAPGETALADDVRIINGGKAANQAIGAAFLGARSAIVTAVGMDPFAAIVLDVLRAHGVSTDGVIEMPGASTMVGAVMVDAAGENRITLAPGALGRLTEGDVRRHARLIEGADVCLVSLEIPPVPAAEALRIARDAGVVTVLNPAPAPAPEALPELLALADWVTPNEGEARAMARALAGPATSEAEDRAEADALRLLAGGARGVVVTLGGAGALLADGLGVRRVPAAPIPAAELVDTSGAGDGFNTAFALALAAGWSIDGAVAAGCEAGSRICRGPGFVEALDTWRGFTLPSEVVDPAG